MNLPVDEQRQARAARELIHAAGGIEAAADVLGKSKSQVGRYQSPTEGDSITLRDIELLESITHGREGHPAVTRYLAQRGGYAMVKLPQVQASGADMLALVAMQAKEGGDITAGLIAALGDGGIDHAEAAKLRTEVGQLIYVAVVMDAELARFMAEGRHG